MRWIFLCALFVSACTTPPPITACPKPVAYTAEQQTRAADERAALPADSMLRVMIADYMREREQLRRCAG